METLTSADGAPDAELGRKVVQQAAVAELGRLALTGVPVPELLEHAVAMTGEGLATDLVAILRLDEELAALTCRANIGWQSDWIRPVPLDGGSQLAHTFVRQEPSIVPDLEEEHAFAGSRHLLAYGIRSAIAVAIRGHGAGVLVAHDRKRRQFTPDDVLFLRGIANVVAAAIENERAREAEAISRERAERLQRVTAQLAGAPALDEVTEVVLGEGLAATGAPAGLVALLDEGGETLTVAAAHGYPEDTLTGWTTFPVAAGVPASEAVRTGEAVFLSTRAERDARYPAVASVYDAPSHALVALPLVAAGNPLGAIAVSFAEERRFDDRERAFLHAVADQCAQAIDRARLYAERERRAEAARALEFVADGVVLVDLEGVVRLWNDSAERITGIAQAEAVGRPVESLVEAWDALSATTRPGRPVTLPVGIRGRELWLSVSTVQFAEGVVYAFRDTTEEHLLDQMKSDFIATVSHELRTPLAAVYGAATTLRRRTELDEAEREQFLEMIEQQSDRLSRIVDEILIASRLDSGALSVELAPVDAVAVAQGVVDVARRTAPHGFQLRVAVNEPLPRVVADADRLRQVLGNLVENAVKYAGGSRAAEVILSAEGGWVSLAVRDHGIGIPPGDRERIFEKFFRVDPAMRQGVSGTGLGLYIVRELVERMNGRIRVESTPGVGSTFVVELPAAATSAA